MDQRDSHCPYSLSSETTAKPTVLGVLVCPSELEFISSRSLVPKRTEIKAIHGVTITQVMSCRVGCLSSDFQSAVGSVIKSCLCNSGARRPF